MENMQFVTPVSVSHTELIVLVESLGGRWNSDVGLDQGSIQEGDAIIYLSLVENLAEDYTSEEIIDFAARLGAQPQTVIDIHIGHEAGSAALAMRIAQVFAQKWNGVLESDTNLQESLSGGESARRNIHVS